MLLHSILGVASHMHNSPDYLSKLVTGSISRIMRMSWCQHLLPLQCVRATLASQRIRTTTHMQILLLLLLIVLSMLLLLLWMVLL